jgi:hypothetical protein
MSHSQADWQMDLTPPKEGDVELPEILLAGSMSDKIHLSSEVPETPKVGDIYKDKDGNPIGVVSSVETDIKGATHINILTSGVVDGTRLFQRNSSQCL